MTTRTFKDAKSFSRTFVQEARDHVEAVGKAAHKFVVGAVYEKILETNPVLTSLSRGNWFLTMGNPSSETTEEIAGVTETGAAMTGKEQGNLEIMEAMIDAAPFGQMVWITNNINYIVYLNAGSSSKAPAGIADVAIVGALSSGSVGRMQQMRLI